MRTPKEPLGDGLPPKGETQTVLRGEKMKLAVE